MEKIKRYRNTQKQTFESFFEEVTDSGICKYCSSFNDCLTVLGEESIDSISGNGCSAFDNSIEEIKKFYLIEMCSHKSE